MVTKKVTETKEIVREIRVCDACGKDTALSCYMYRCHICGRDICHDCYCGDKEYIEWCQFCHPCWEEGESFRKRCRESREHYYEEQARIEKEWKQHMKDIGILVVER